MLSYHRDLTADILEQSAVFRGLAALDCRVIRVMGDREQAIDGFHLTIIIIRSRVLTIQSSYRRLESPSEALTSSSDIFWGFLSGGGAATPPTLLIAPAGGELGDSGRGGGGGALCAGDRGRGAGDHPP